MTLASKMSVVVDQNRTLQYVSPAEFVRHLTSHSRMVRSDEPASNLIGITDCESGVRYVVPSTELARYRTECRPTVVRTVDE